MNPKRWAQIEALFDQAVTLDADARKGLLARACQDDPELLEEVQSLLDADENSPTFLDSNAAEFAAPAVSFERPQVLPSTIGNAGPYKLIKEIGHGGMSVVYLGERDDGEFHQKVAVKLLRHLGGNAEDRELRFRSEREILAGLEHPHIARVIDGGVTDGGWPYLAMEFIEGQPIHTYCDEQKLDQKARIRLFEAVCHAVQHAHQRLIVHRDIKPGNILVQPPQSGTTVPGDQLPGLPKLLDFGIAKLLEENDSQSPQTRTGFLLMTPEYAAPEQVRGEAITTATDVYALGVLLYELIAGQRPYVLEATSAAELERQVCSVQPSAIEEVEEDLNAIIQKALRKEPNERYVSAADFAEDLRRYRKGLPVEARLPTTGYRIAKFVGRHRWAVSLATIAVLVVVGFGVSMAYLRGEAAHERDRANEQAQSTEQALSFLTGLFQVSDPRLALGETMTARDALDAGARALQNGDAYRPVVRARLAATIGEVYRNLGLFDSAEPLLTEALALREEHLGHDHLDTAESLRSLARLKEFQGDPAAGAELMGRALATYREQLGTEHVTTIATIAMMGDLLSDTGDLERGLELFREAFQLSRDSLGPEHETTQAIRVSLAVQLKNQGRIEEAEPHYRDGFSLLRRLLGPDHPDVLTAQRNLALLLLRKSEPEEAEKLFREVRERAERVLGSDHPTTLGALNDLGSALSEQKRYAEEAVIRQEVLDAEIRINGPEHPNALRAMNNLAVLRVSLKEYEAADALFAEVVQGVRKAMGPKHPVTLLTEGSWADTRFNLGHVEEAESMLRSTLATMEATLPDGHPYTGYNLSRLGAVLTAQGRFDEAEQRLNEAQAILSTALGEGHSQRTLLARRLDELAAARNSSGG